MTFPLVTWAHFLPIKEGIACFHSSESLLPLEIKGLLCRSLLSDKINLCKIGVASTLTISVCTLGETEEQQQKKIKVAERLVWRLCSGKPKARRIVLWDLW